MIEIILLLLSGLSEGIVSGLYGGSGSPFVIGLLTVLGNFHAYKAIGIALAIDFFASLTAFLIYRKNKNIEIKPALPFIISMVLGIIIGSFISAGIPSKLLSLLAGIGIIIGSTKFFKKTDITKSLNTKLSKKSKILISIFFGILVGFILGTIGGGGGLAVLMVLVIFYNYPIHKAIGTSVFGMIFVALFGAIAHFKNMPFTPTEILIGAIGGIIGAFLVANKANKIKAQTLSKIIGIIMICLGILLILRNI